MRPPTIFEDPALRWFLIYALVCSLTGIAILFVMRELAPFEVDKPAEQAANGELDESRFADKPAEPAVVRPDEPAVVRPDGPEVVTGSTPPAVGSKPTAPSVVGPAEPALRGPFEPVIIEKGDRLPR